MTTTRMAVNLSNFYGVDRILFGNLNPRDVLKESEFEDYEVAKGALLSNVYSLYKKVGYAPKKSFKNAREIVEHGSKSAVRALNRAKKLVETTAVTKCLKEDFNQIISKNKKVASKKKLARELTLESIQKIALDSMLLESAIKTGCPVCMMNWNTKILVDAHKVLRDALVKYTK